MCCRCDLCADYVDALVEYQLSGKGKRRMKKLETRVRNAHMDYPDEALERMIELLREEAEWVASYLHDGVPPNADELVQ